MTVSVCIAGLGVIIITSWYSFMWQLATRSEQKRRLERQLEEKQLEENRRPFDNELSFTETDSSDAA